MKAAIIVGCVALFLATGTAHAEDNIDHWAAISKWECALVWMPQSSVHAEDDVYKEPKNTSKTCQRSSKSSKRLKACARSQSVSTTAKRARSNTATRTTGDGDEKDSPNRYRCAVPGNVNLCRTNRSGRHLGH